MDQIQSLPVRVGAVLALTLAVSGPVFAYNGNDAIRDCENRIRSDYGFPDLRDTRAVQLPGEKRYKVDGVAKVDGERYPWTCRVDDRRVVDINLVGRRPPRRSDGPPVISPRPRGELSVRLPNGCEARYDRNGDMTSRTGNCSPRDIHRADDAVESYLRERRPEPADRGDDRREAPQVLTTRNGGNKVVFRNDCTVYYDQEGRRRDVSPDCDRDQVRDADRAFDAYRSDDRYR